MVLSSDVLYFATGSHTLFLVPFPLTKVPLTGQLLLIDFRLHHLDILVIHIAGKVQHLYPRASAHVRAVPVRIYILMEAAPTRGSACEACYIEFYYILTGRF